MRLLSVIVLLLSAASAHGQDLCDSPLVVSYSGDWEPYYYQYARNQYDGTDYDLLLDVITGMGCQLEVLPMTEERSIIELSKGSFDISLGASYTTERNQRFYFSIPYRTETVGMMLVTNHGWNKHTTLDSILASGGIVTINMQGYFGQHVDTLKARYPKQFVHGFSLPQRVAMLNDAHVSAIVDDRTALCTQLQSLKMLPAAPGNTDSTHNNMIMADEIINQSDVHFIFSRKTIEPPFVDAFNLQLQRALTTATTDNNGICSSLSE